MQVIYNGTCNCSILSWFSIQRFISVSKNLRCGKLFCYFDLICIPLGSFKCPRHVNAPIRVIFRLVSFRARKKTSLLRIGSPVTSFAEATLWYFGWIVNSSASFHFSPVAFSSCIHFPRFFVLATVSLFSHWQFIGFVNFTCMRFFFSATSDIVYVPTVTASSTLHVKY